MFELEIYKEGGSPMIQPPDPTQFELFSPLLKNWQRLASIHTLDRSREPPASRTYQDGQRAGSGLA